MPTGDLELIATITDEIRSGGPMTFARFMELALYEPTRGYYTRPGSGEDRIGPQGDFYTTSDVHPLLARALALQIHQTYEHLAQPSPMTLLEMGPGKGLLARDLLSASERIGIPFAQDLRCLLVERSETMKARQRAALEPWLERPDRVSWVESLEKVESGSLTGVVLSNELVDAFPVHRVTVEAGEFKEIHVDLEDGRFVERLTAPSTPELARYFERLGIVLEEGQVAEVNLAALSWIQEVARVLRRGFVITIDYGHTAQDLYGAARRNGTMLCYYRHTVSEDPYERIGLQDMTAHVDFTSLAFAGEESGLETTGFTNQMGFLAGLPVEGLLQHLDPNSPELRSAAALLHPGGMGRTFKILVQHKGIDRPELDGLRFKPFFDSALAPRAVGAAASRLEATGKRSEKG